MKSIDIFSVLFAGAIYLVMHVFWYSKYFFGKIREKQKKEVKSLIVSYIFTFLSVFIISYVIALFEVLLGVASFWDGIFLGFLIWLGFVGPHGIFLVISFNSNFKNFIIDNILYLLGLMIVSGILAG